MVLPGDSRVYNARYKYPKHSTGYTYAVEVLEANKAFIIAEVHAYIAVTYPKLHI